MIIIILNYLRLFFSQQIAISQVLFSVSQNSQTLEFDNYFLLDFMFQYPKFNTYYKFIAKD